MAASDVDGSQLSARSIERRVYGKLVAYANRRCRPEAAVRNGQVNRLKADAQRWR